MLAALLLLGSTLCALLLTPVVRSLAVRHQLLDYALSARKIHGRPVPRLGGVAIVVAFYLPLLALAGWPGGNLPGVFPDVRHAVGMLAGGLAIGLLGVYDDLFGAGAGIKFTAQFLAAAFAYWMGFRVDALATPFGATIELGVFSIPLTLLWIVGITNAFNLIDGLDGLAGGVALIAVMTNFVIAVGRQEIDTMLILAALAGAILGFLVYNFNPASIFMGDSGSMFVGFVLATTAIEAHQKSSAAVALLIPITVLGLPILDTLLALTRRVARGKPLFSADREHIHHRLLAMGLTQREAVIVLYLLAALLGATALALTSANSTQTVAILGGLGGVLYLLLSRLHARGSTPSRQQRDEALAVMRRIADVLTSKRWLEPTDAWEAAKELAAAIGAESTSLYLSRSLAREGDTLTRSFSAGVDKGGGELALVCFTLKAHGQELGTLEFGWRGASADLDEQTEAALQWSCETLALALLPWHTEGRRHDPSRRVVALRKP